MSDSEGAINHNNEAEEEEDQDLQMAFVVLLMDYKVLFDKRQTPAVKGEKDKAVTEFALAYSKNTKLNFSSKQVMKKFNNMKTKVKAASDKMRTGNRKIILSEWQKKFFKLWDEGHNPVLNKVPGAIESGVPSTSTKLLLPPPPAKKRKCLNLEEEPEEFQNKNLQQLQA